MIKNRKYLIYVAIVFSIVIGLVFTAVILRFELKEYVPDSKQADKMTVYVHPIQSLDSHTKDTTGLNSEKQTKNINTPELINEFLSRQKLPSCGFDQITYDNAARDIQEYLKSLANSSNETESRMYALFGFSSSEASQRVSLIRQHLKRFPNDKVVARRLLLECSIASKSELCPEQEVSQILTILPDNAAYWQDVANYYAGIEDDSKFEESLSLALQSNSYDETFVSELLEFVTFLDQAQVADFPEIVFHASGYAAAVPWALANINKRCLNDINPGYISDMCFQLGRDMEQRGKQLLTTQIGIQIQIKIAKKNGQENLVHYLSAKASAMDQAASIANYEVIGHAAYDRELFSVWQNVLQSSGELASLNAVQKEIFNKLKDPNYVLCQ